jgi:hypothetical protein
MEINAKIAKMFSSGECVMWNIYDKPEDAFYDGDKITIQKLNSIVLPKTDSKKLIILPCNRSSDYYKHIELSTKEYTYNELFTKLHEFYTKKNLTLTELKRIPNDFKDYVKDAIKNGVTISFIDIMGANCRFEDITRLNKNLDHIYSIYLGS